MSSPKIFTVDLSSLATLAAGDISPLKVSTAAFERLAKTKAVTFGNGIGTWPLVETETDEELFTITGRKSGTR